MRCFIITGFIIIVYFASAQKPDGYDKELATMYKNTVKKISATDLKNEIEKNPDLVLLDTREKEEFKVSHLIGARNVGYNEFSLKSVEDLPKNTPIIVYCSLGVRSERIGEQLQQAGYNQVQNLYGGIFEWVYADMPVVDKKGNITEKVHAYDKTWSKWLIKGEKVY